MEKVNGGDTETCISIIDYENCSNLKNISLKEYTEINNLYWFSAAKCFIAC